MKSYRTPQGYLSDPPMAVEFRMEPDFPSGLFRLLPLSFCLFVVGSSQKGNRTPRNSSGVVASSIRKRASGWRIELFLKRIKQIQRRENAAPTQTWIALCVYLMAPCLNKAQEINETPSRIGLFLIV